MLISFQKWRSWFVLLSLHFSARHPPNNTYSLGYAMPPWNLIQVIWAQCDHILRNKIERNKTLCKCNNSNAYRHFINVVIKSAGQDSLMWQLAITLTSFSSDVVKLKSFSSVLGHASAIVMYSTWVTFTTIVKTEFPDQVLKLSRVLYNRRTKERNRNTTCEILNNHMQQISTYITPKLT